LISESNILNCFQHLVEDIENSNVILGSGDDAAVIKSNIKDLVHSLDISKVGTHFPEDSSPEDIAYRSVAVALSDLAAMGAFPSFISIGLSSNIKEIKWYERFTSGIEDILNEYKIKLVGGDVTFGEISICVNVFGYPYESIVKRSGALSDDQIYITGPLGKGRRGLEDWKNKKKSNYVDDFFRPKIQFDTAQFISNYATSCIDISDGLVKDLHSICKLSKVGAIIDINKIPIINDIEDLVYGDDYQLCFTCSTENIRHIKDYNFYNIGIIQSNPKIEYMRNNKSVSFDKEGWDSFK
tara:strand:- start:1355 stop:2245 length:891 start_codon:yes stop_codon:yes gene_type:complete